MEGEELLIIIFGSFASIVLVCICGKFIKDRETERKEKNKIDNVRKRLMAKNIIHPIIESKDEEVKDEYLQYEIRTPQITGEENV